MSFLNKIKSIPFKNDKVIDVQFAIGHGMATIHFESGKALRIHIDDDATYNRRSYMEDVAKNNREIKIENLLDGESK